MIKLKRFILIKNYYSKKQNFSGRKLFIPVFSLLALSLALPALAYVASSTNYRLQSDSLNFAGNLSTSSSYNLQDTFGESGTGTSSSATYNLHAGYQAMNSDVSLTVSAPGNVTLSPAVDAKIGGSATGQAIWSVMTDDSAGYTITLAADTSPALKSSTDSFADYSSSPSFTWSVTSANANFGYSVLSTDAASAFLNNGSACNIGSTNTADRCWRGLSTSAVTVVSRSTANNPSGITSTVKFQAEAGSGREVTAGTYSATVNAIVTAN
ncbi:MAG: hypothetical protein COX02_00740 [Candidatus Vogelbacteria bacterium CG22_combo_CG10-13_8_21_14_all_37_9]|uniref:Uncharacterized protein n=1 Tax=Candidatus Vogelbacteria bacterium CG22_combo_CG10-13_8_21_14_all_37_9 TaxID=1975046 RepID=A0A2H0BLE6_9BACT|nr:MAG: hypothetical protein COX02_00740 [Candidatus Vogelbacteria bacterium CG22_combo_CG10-13_8_21_14_all_37_9]